MNRAIKAAILNPQRNYIFQRAAFFHSTTVFEYKRGNHWQFGKRLRRRRAKQELLRNVSAYADFMFESWKNEFHEDDPSSSRGSSWFKKWYSKGTRRDRPGNGGFQYMGRRPFEFFEDDDDIENIFRSAFGGSRFFYWSFINEEHRHWGSSNRYSNNYEKSWNWRYRFDEGSDSSTESGTSESLDKDTVADRQALGLSACGPLTLEDIKTAYRTCALKWHPDRHHGSSKVSTFPIHHHQGTLFVVLPRLLDSIQIVITALPRYQHSPFNIIRAVAEEKFKLCNSSYQSLCDKLGVN